MSSTSTSRMALLFEWDETEGLPTSNPALGQQILTPQFPGAS